jgi:microcystin-dependent protein
VGNLAATDVQSALLELDTEKAPLASPALTGTPTAPTASAGTNSTQLATTAFVQGHVSTLNASIAAKASTASPAFTGNPTAPTPALTDSDTSIATTAFVQGLIEDILVGTIQAFAGAAIPTGYLVCDGTAVSRTTYAKLFAKIGTSHGAGDGSSTFNLPDLCGRAIIGRDTAAKNRVTAAVSGLDSAALGNAGGSQSMQNHAHSASAAQDGHTHSDAGHTHTATQAGHNHTVTDVNVEANASGAAMAAGFQIRERSDTRTTSTVAPAITVATGFASLNWQQPNVYVTVNANGSGGSQNVQPSIVENYIIYAGR